MKKRTLQIIFVAFAVIIIATILIISSMKNKNYKNYEIIEISYSYGGGFGTIVDTSNKTITFTPDGIVKLSNSYNSYTETFNIDRSKYNELNDFVKVNLSLFAEKPKEDKNVLDGGNSSIQIKLKNGQIKEIGGYMIENKKFHKIKNKIYEIIDYKRLNQYEDKLRLMNKWIKYVIYYF